MVDNWSGASLLPSLYEAVKSQMCERYLYLRWLHRRGTGEIGSHFYVRQMTKEQVAATDAMVNIDTLGLDRTEV